MRHVRGIVDVQMIASVVAWEQSGRVARVADDRIEVDHAIEFMAGTNPGVDFLADLLFFSGRECDRRLPKQGVLERRDRRHDGPDARLVRSRNQLAIAANQILGAHLETASLEKSIAVLPFVDLTEKMSEEEFRNEGCERLATGAGFGYPAFGTNASARRGLSTRMVWSVASSTPACFKRGTMVVMTMEMPGPPFFRRYF